ncbi:serine protease [Phycisphaerales bacterium AB-hyl4]|uniref:Serine protease n=1 Tax=Natronomicrosphaera hydrolytica TaxID=3242702 RepID=A0ABV4U1K8_9BACT
MAGETALRLMVVALASAMLGLAGCRWHDVQHPPAPSPDERAASFEELASRTVDGVPLETHLRALTFRLAGNLVPVVDENGTRFESADGSGTYGQGLAVPLTADGYFLTAAHVVNLLPEPIYVMSWHTGEAVIAPVRVVWRGAEGDYLADGVLDLAIIHAPLTLEVAAEWAVEEELQVETPLVGMGGTGFWPPIASGGRLNEITTAVNREACAAGEFVFRFIQHDVPIGHGDSGGPIMLADGRLVGITVRGQTRLTTTRRRVVGKSKRVERTLEHRNTVLRPEPDILMKLIESDRGSSLAE